VLSLPIDCPIARCPIVPRFRVLARQLLLAFPDLATLCLPHRCDSARLRQLTKSFLRKPLIETELIRAFGTRTVVSCRNSNWPDSRLIQPLRSIAEFWLPLFRITLSVFGN
jgi:hypothetical protein